MTIWTHSWRQLLFGAAVLLTGILPVQDGCAQEGAGAAAMEPLPGSERLTLTGDLSAQMRAGFDRFLTRELDASVADRRRHWQRDFSSAAGYQKSIEPNRQRFRTMIGAVDARTAAAGFEVVQTIDQPSLLAEAGSYTVRAVRWSVLPGVTGTGLLLQPRARPAACVVALPDADQTPEQLTGLEPGIPESQQFARRLAEHGCLVLVPVLISRSSEGSGNPAVAMTNQSHREWVYRQAWELGRHVIGYEVQKVLAAVDRFSDSEFGEGVPIGVAGYGEGGLVAFYSAAVEPRIASTLVSGYFNSRQQLPEEPIERNLFGLLREFGDAEIASLIAPRPLVIECSPGPQYTSPPQAAANRRAVAAPGRLSTPETESVRGEFERLRRLYPDDPVFRDSVTLVEGTGGVPVEPASDAALQAFLRPLTATAAAGAVDRPKLLTNLPSTAARQLQQLQELVEYNQRLMRNSANVRAKYWSAAVPKTADEWPAATAQLRAECWDQLLGRFPDPTLPASPRSRRIIDSARWTAWEVVLDVFPDVFCWGYLLVPKDIRGDERRPVVVCQHGLEGVPADVVTQEPGNPAFPVYRGFAAALADRGFVTWAPHNFYRGGNEFRQLQRKANPLGKTLFGLTTAQHQQHLAWLKSLPFVDPERIGFYGLSYGGNTAVRVPAVLTDYQCVIASGDFNDWVYKNVTTDHNYSMIYHNVYEVFEWNLAHTFSHAELSALIAPRPFMVERGHRDGVALDEWVAAEYAKVRRLYAFLGIPERTTIEFFNGPHAINGEETYDFLHQHLNWPRTAAH